uniref:Lipocalin n=1 Tax=Rhipicephalus appendiculatus TaxID=34631 RepID=A0A131YHD4_RHIAP
MKSPLLLRTVSLVYLATAKVTSISPHFEPGGTGAALNIKQFVNTTDPIWTYNSTENTFILCKVDQTSDITEERYIFNRSYYAGYHNWTTLDGKGTFTSEDPASVDVVLKKDSTSGYTYSDKLLYTDNYTSCGIFFVKPMNGDANGWYEHRVKNSSITKRKDKGCTSFFKNMTTRGRKVFRPHCLHMLRIGNATYSRWELH